MLKKISFAVGAALVGVLCIGGPANAGIVLWDNVGYGGDSRDLGNGLQLALGTWNDRASAVKISGTTAVLYEHENYGGAATPSWSTNKSDLRDYGFNDRASSVY